MFTIKDIRRELDRLDSISGMTTSSIPIRVSARMTKTWGKCVYSKTRSSYKVLELVFSDRLLRYATDEHIKEVIRHEYAHAFVTIKYNRAEGHSNLWRQWAIRFGSSGQRLISFPEVTEALANQAARYIVQCAGCGAVFRYQRKSNIVKALEADPNCPSYYCRRCRGNLFILLKATKNTN